MRCRWHEPEVLTDNVAYKKRLWALPGGSKSNQWNRYHKCTLHPAFGQKPSEGNLSNFRYATVFDATLIRSISYAGHNYKDMTSSTSKSSKIQKRFMFQKLFGKIKIPLINCLPNMKIWEKRRQDLCDFKTIWIQIIKHKKILKTISY